MNSLINLKDLCGKNISALVFLALCLYWIDNKTDYMSCLFGKNSRFAFLKQDFAK